MEQLLRTLVAFGTRNTLGDDLGESRDRRCATY